ncbi:MAG TPA: methionine--tRNA ligase [Acidobacteriota bacterium]|nr:methionine--tRNA ligase [Acidobacteriota bacterium]HRR25672.1 methionine--tRNA ligase [Acidobacteriota bacterium]HRV09130.1 methionine--tRNA ligase [Acidobacteriota bacterium]
MGKQFYLTTPLYYVNGVPHVGHVYTTVIADAIAEFKRLQRLPVCALTGTDEHGLKIERAAREAGLTPQELADRYAAEFQRTWEEMELKFDAFIRTTEPRHTVAVTELARRIKEKGHIYLGEYSGNYCVSCEAYAPEGEKNCPDCGRPTEFMKEESYFFKLSAFQERLLRFYESHPDFVLPVSRMNEIVSFVRSGLKDVSISRTSFRWGIPLPDDPEHIFYVWFDALTGYLSGVGFGTDPAAFAERWPADVQLIGKDILRFHAVYWPAFLMAAGLEPPRHILVNGWWTVEGEKMSKSRGNFITARDLLSKFPPDYIKYFLLREIPIGGDGDFSWEAFVNRCNSDLANDFGNLVNRTLKMIENYSGGVIPEKGDDEGGDVELIRFSRETVELYKEQFDRLQINRALETVWELVAAVNRYLVANEPWALARESSKRTRLNTVLFNTAETIRLIAVMVSPVLRRGARAVLEQLGIGGEVDRLGPEDLKWGVLKPGTRLGKVDVVYPRLDLDLVHASDSPSEGRSSLGEAPTGEEKPRIAIDDFAKIDMRVGRVISAERIPKSKKLLKLMVDIGDEVRQVVAGIGEAYSPESLTGRLVVLVANLQPVRLMGVESNGMIVAATVGDRPVLATFQEEVPPGARLK